ncbi:MAG TPA: hypothetical protein VGR00_11165 [Thermoanaerobaculia bacterium]|nr:hypothetical protein [Thermoanaerobaculia bacterium]
MRATILGMMAELALALLLQTKPPTPAKTPQPTGAFVVLDRIAAVVGDEIILESEIDRIVAIGLTPGKDAESAAAYKDRVLEERIVDVLREKELRLTGLEADPREVETRYTSLAERVAKQRGVSFDKVLESSGVTKEEAKDWIRRGIQLETYTRERLSPTIKVSDVEVEAYCQGPYREEMTAKKLAIAPCADVAESIRNLLRETKLNEEIERWTEGLRRKTRVVVYRRTALPVAPSPGASPSDAAKR